MLLSLGSYLLVVGWVTLKCAVYMVVICSESVIATIYIYLQAIAVALLDTICILNSVSLLHIMSFQDKMHYIISCLNSVCIQFHWGILASLYSTWELHSFSCLVKYLQTEFKRITSPLKYQTRCVAAFPDQQGFLVFMYFIHCYYYESEQDFITLRTLCTFSCEIYVLWSGGPSPCL